MMKKFQAVMAVAAWCCLAVCAAGQGAVDLAWKWEKGRTLTYRMQEEMTGKGTGMFEGLAINSAREFVYEDVVEDLSPSGVAKVRRTFKSLKMTAEDGEGGRVQYDSTKPGLSRPRDAADHPQVKPYASMVGKSITFEIDAEGRVTDVDGYRELVADAIASTGLGAQLGQIASAMTSDEQYRQFVESAMRVVPGKAVSRGDSWEVKVAQPLAGLGVNQTTKYTFKKADRRGQASVAEIDAAGAFTMKSNPAITALLGEISMDESTCKGVVHFDVARGYITDSKMDTKFRFRLESVDPQTGRKMEAGSLMLSQSAKLELIPRK